MKNKNSIKIVLKYKYFMWIKKLHKILIFFYFDYKIHLNSSMDKKYNEQKSTILVSKIEPVPNVQ